jgi:8-oxo-dGTP diphosphatase
VREQVRAAGGVVLRHGQGGELEVLVVHRPRYDDWSFPKGKLEPGETDEEAAVREVEEETGLRCVLRRELSSTSYDDSRGRSKRVRYWLMECAAEPSADALTAFAATAEVDDVRFLPLDDAGRLLTYERDRALLAEIGDGA